MRVLQSNIPYASGNPNSIRLEFPVLPRLTEKD
jgi:hypothetical protein